MSAVAAQKTRATTPRSKTATAPASCENGEPLFVAVSDLLRNAWLTDEAHEYSGESDRLISAAIMLAESAPTDEPLGKSQNRAFDIAACINAARLVPGDTESPERSAYLTQVGIILAEITETTPNEILHTNVPRPGRPGKQPKLTRKEVIELHFDAVCHMSCALGVLKMHAENADSAAIFALRDLLSTYQEKAEAAQSSVEVGDFIDGILPDLSATLDRIEDLVSTVLDGHDHVVLHAVAYLS